MRLAKGLGARPGGIMLLAPDSEPQEQASCYLYKDPPPLLSLANTNVVPT